MNVRTYGIHHVTAIAGDPQQNLDFYAGLLGMRLVKLTVNFDDPGAYHLYYGDHVGHPGTVLTFFSWPGAPRGRQGVSQVAVTSLAIPRSALDFWLDRLARGRVAHDEPGRRFDETVVAFHDPDGLALELITDASLDGQPAWSTEEIPEEHAIRGFHGVTLWEEQTGPTGMLLSETLGFQQVEQEHGTSRYVSGQVGPGAVVDVRDASGLPGGAIAVGTVHHVAYRVPDDATQLALRDRLQALGYQVTGVRDRTYFHSIYFTEPGGVLFEIATDPPGFTIDEPEAELGTHLKLPAWLESRRALVERALPPVRLPGVAVRNRA